jgi:hypothetical protein
MSDDAERPSGFMELVVRQKRDIDRAKVLKCTEAGHEAMSDVNLGNTELLTFIHRDMKAEFASLRGMSDQITNALRVHVDGMRDGLTVQMQGIAHSEAKRYVDTLTGTRRDLVVVGQTGETGKTGETGARGERGSFPLAALQGFVSAFKSAPAAMAICAVSGVFGLVIFVFAKGMKWL